MRARIIALGQRAAGDDAVGLAVLDFLRREIEPCDTGQSCYSAERSGDDAGLVLADQLLGGAASAAGGLDRAQAPSPFKGMRERLDTHQPCENAEKAGPCRIHERPVDSQGDARGRGRCGSRTVAWSVAELCEATDATELIPLLRYRGLVILIDAFVGTETPGTVRELPVQAIEADGPAPLSSHALSVRQAIDLARTLYPGELAPFVRIVGISITPPERHGTSLSPPVAEAVPRAADAIARILEGEKARTEIGNRAAKDLRHPEGGNGERERVRLAISIGGLVQGVGFRPFVYRAARSHGLVGWVRNAPDGVRIEVEGTQPSLGDFFATLEAEVASPAEIQGFGVAEIVSGIVDSEGRREAQA